MYKVKTFDNLDAVVTFLNDVNIDESKFKQVFAIGSKFQLLYFDDNVEEKEDQSNINTQETHLCPKCKESMVLHDKYSNINSLGNLCTTLLYRCPKCNCFLRLYDNDRYNITLY